MGFRRVDGCKMAKDGFWSLYLVEKQDNNKNLQTMAKKTSIKKKEKKWTAVEEIELPNLYLTLDWSYAALAKRFRCSVAEVRRKVREMGIEQ